jgi:hypothetical protein
VLNQKEDPDYPINPPLIPNNDPSDKIKRIFAITVKREAE